MMQQYYPELKNIAFFLVKITLTLLVIFAFFKFAGPLPLSISSVTTNKGDEFIVTGEGKASVKPDSAKVRVGVQANGATAKEAQEEINEIINKVKEAIINLGIKKEDIKTENYNIYPNQDYTEGNIGKIISYSANTNLLITVKDITKADSIVDGATAAGANQVGGVEFDVKDRTGAEGEARTKAVAEAKNKAEQAAKASGFSLGKIISYQEGFGPGPIMLLEEKGGRGGGGSEIEPGTNEITVTVTLGYEIR